MTDLDEFLNWDYSENNQRAESPPFFFLLTPPDPLNTNDTQIQNNNTRTTDTSNAVCQPLLTSTDSDAFHKNNLAKLESTRPVAKEKKCSEFSASKPNIHTALGNQRGRTTLSNNERRKTSSHVARSHQTQQKTTTYKNITSDDKPHVITAIVPVPSDTITGKTDRNMHLDEINIGMTPIHSLASVPNDITMNMEIICKSKNGEHYSAPYHFSERIHSHKKNENKKTLCRPVEWKECDDGSYVIKELSGLCIRKRRNSIYGKKDEHGKEYYMVPKYPSGVPENFGSIGPTNLADYLNFKQPLLGIRFCSDSPLNIQIDGIVNNQSFSLSHMDAVPVLHQDSDDQLDVLNMENTISYGDILLTDDPMSPSNKCVELSLEGLQAPIDDIGGMMQLSYWQTN